MSDNEDSMAMAAAQANERLTEALQGLVIAAHGTRVMPDEAYASAVGRMNAWASRIEALTQQIESEADYLITQGDY